MATADLFPQLRRSRTEQLFQRYFLLIFLLATLALIANELFVVRDIFDSLFVSGVLLFLVGVLMAMQSPGRMRRTLTQLIDRGALEIPSDQIDTFERQIAQVVQRSSRRGAVISTIALVLAFVAADSIFIVYAIQRGGRLSQAFYSAAISQVVLTLFEAILAYIVGHYLGRAVAYGRLGLLLDRLHIRIRIQPHHLDGAAGLKPIGDFYFFQATLLAIPAVFLGVWWFLITYVPALDDLYAQWRDPYLGLLGMIVVGEILAFIVPMWSFHVRMQQEKVALMREADRLSAHIAALQSQLATASLSREAYPAELTDQITSMTTQYWAIQHMTTWPVNAQTWRRFTLNNLGLILPFVVQFVNVGDVFHRLFG